MVSFLKISEKHFKNLEKVDFYSSISLSGSGLQIRIRPCNLNQDPTGSKTLHIFVTALLIGRTRIWFIYFSSAGSGSGQILTGSATLISRFVTSRILNLLQAKQNIYQTSPSNLQRKIPVCHNGTASGSGSLRLPKEGVADEAAVSASSRHLLQVFSCQLFQFP